MPIDFFATPCINPKGNCQSESVHCLQAINTDFGVNDANSNHRLPAKVVLDNSLNWDLIIENQTNKDVFFKAVDYCVVIFRAGNYDLEDDNRDSANFDVTDIISNNIRPESIKRCEGFITYDNNILFFEIKTGSYGSWLKDAREKFEETMLSFEQTHPNHNLTRIKPIVSNKRLITHQNLAFQKRILKDKVGIEFDLAYKHTISV